VAADRNTSSGNFFRGRTDGVEENQQLEVDTMAVSLARTHHLGQVYSPFSGQPADGDDGPNEGDPTLLFVSYGGEFAYVSDRLKALVDVVAENVDMADLTDVLTIDGGLILEVDTDWNGVNHYGFAPHS
jgi:hypothetical protein